MKTGTKVTLAFLGGAVAGAAVLAYLNRDKLNWDGIKPAAADLLEKGEQLKQTLLDKFETLKEELSKTAEDEADLLEKGEQLKQTLLDKFETLKEELFKTAEDEAVIVKEDQA